MDSKIALEVRGLSKSFDEKKVVNQIDLQVRKGECFGILGPNGAGKSTLMKMLYGSAVPTEGDLFVLGYNGKNSFRQIKSRIGVIPQEDGLDVEFSVFENLMLYSRFHGIETAVAAQRSTELIHLMRLDEVSDKYVQALSGGMKRRLAIARGMINRPDLLFLDEPTTGLDPQARLWIWEFLRKIKEEMGTVVLTTHYMEEAESICDRIAILDRGQILALGSPAELIEKHIGHEIIEFGVSQSEISYETNKIKSAGFDYIVIGNSIHIFVRQPKSGRDVLNLIQSRRVTMRKPNLNDVFLKIAGHELREDII